MGLDIYIQAEFRDLATRKLDEFERDNNITNKYGSEIYTFKNIDIVPNIRNDHVLKRILIDEYKIENCQRLDLNLDDYKKMIKLIEDNFNKYQEVCEVETYADSINKLEAGLELLKKILKDKTMEVEEVFLKMWW